MAALSGPGVTGTLVALDARAQGESAALQYTGVTREAVVEETRKAAGIVVCTESDALNLAKVTRVRAVNPRVYVVIRQVNVANAGLVDASMAKLRFVKSEVVSHKARQLLYVRTGVEPPRSWLFRRLLERYDRARESLPT